jgi:D-3-phosphoglycerate dehydrogenase / 2-oxoglutarate reductase
VFLLVKIVSSSPTFGLYSNDPVSLLQSKGYELELLDREVTSNEEKFAEALKDADALIVGVEKITATVLAGAKNLKVIAKHGAGVDNIDLPEAAKRKIVVTNAPGANRHAVADMVFGLFLSIARSIPSANQEVKTNKWPRFVGNEIFQKKLGVIGTGRIGREVIRRAQGFKMTVLCYDLYPSEDIKLGNLGTYVSLEELLRESDFITIHTDLNDDSKAMIGEAELTSMKKNAFIVNTARGGIIDEEALYQALVNGEIKGAALDVFEQEPLSDTALLSLPNFVATPHMAGYTEEALREVGMLTAQNVIDVIEERQPAFVI